MEKNRSVVAAVLLSLPMPGLGHLYCGRLFLAVMFWVLHFLGWVVFLVGWGLLDWEIQTASRLAFSSFMLITLVAMVHSGLIAKRLDEKYKLKGYNLWYFYLLVWLMAWAGPTFGVFQAIRAKLLTTYPLMSDGMYPSLLMGDRIRVDRRDLTIEQVRPGTVVALVDPLDEQNVRILRIVAVAGQQVTLTKGQLLIDSKEVPKKGPQEEKYWRQDSNGEWSERACASFEEQYSGRSVSVVENVESGERRDGKWTVPEGQVLLLGDNRIDAVDSTSFGPVPSEAILGVAFQVRYSMDPRKNDWRHERRALPIE